MTFTKSEWQDWKNGLSDALSEIQDDWDGMGGVAPKPEHIKALCDQVKCFDVPPPVEPVIEIDEDGQLLFDLWVGGSLHTFSNSDSGQIIYANSKSGKTFDVGDKALLAIWCDLCSCTNVPV